jgi:SET domain-containing protein
VSRYNSHNQTGLLYLEACYKAGKADLAEKIRKDIRKDLEQQQKYYNYIRDSKPEFFGGFERSESPINEIMLQVLDAIEKKYAPQVQIKTPTEGNNPAIINKADKDSGAKKDTNK